jgi:hypothetical protein
MDDYLEMLMESSALSAKAALIGAMLPLTKQQEVMRDLRKQLNSAELDEMLAMCGAMDDRSLAVTAAILDGAIGGTKTWEGFRIRALYGPAVAPIIDAFRPEGTMPAFEVNGIVKHMKDRGTAGLPLKAQIAIARGACIRRYTSGFMTMESASDNELMWLGSNHSRIVPLADDLKERKSSDPLLITELIRGNQTTLVSGVL